MKNYESLLGNEKVKSVRKKERRSPKIYLDAINKSTELVFICPPKKIVKMADPLSISRKQIHPSP